MNNWENRLLLKPEGTQAYEDGGKEGEQRERWEKHFRVRQFANRPEA